MIDGYVVCQVDTAHSTENWHYQFNQTGQFTALPDIPYILKFVAWADRDRNICVDFEDTGANNYNRYGASGDEHATNGRSEWTFPVTTTPTWYTFHVTFDQIIPTTVQKIQFMLTQAVGTVFLDSILLISEADLALTTSAAMPEMASFKVYPNPAVRNLTVELNAPNTRVTIYNSLGVKMEEALVPGTRHTFDVSSYTKGLYFVKAGNAVVKFLK